LEIDVVAQSPLSGVGQFGVGFGLQAWQSRYRGADIGTMPVPVLTYIGERVQVLGPQIFYEVASLGKLSLAATLSYRFPAYEESDSDYPVGMGDRDGIVMSGVSVKAELSDTLSANFRYEHDILDTIGGGVANIQLRNTQQFGDAQWYVGVGFDWLSSSISNHEFGVPTSAMTSTRPTYSPGNVSSLQALLGANVSVTSDWRLLISLLADFYNEEATASPIVDKDYGINLFTAVSYSF